MELATGVVTKIINGHVHVYTKSEWLKKQHKKWWQITKSKYYE